MSSITRLSSSRNLLPSGSGGRQGHTLAYSEYGLGDFRRVFALSNEIDREGIQATVKNGVLKLVLPKSKRAMPRKISVQVE